MVLEVLIPEIGYLFLPFCYCVPGVVAKLYNLILEF